MLDGFLKHPGIPLRVRKKVGKLLRVPQGRAFEARVHECVYRGVTGSHLDDKLYLYGSHEPASIRLMRAILRAQRAHGMSPVYMDVGTNTGAHLIAVAPEADRAFGFEPWAPVRAKADTNISANALAHTKVCAFGLSDTDALLPFAPPVGGNHGTGSFYRHDETHSDMLKVIRGDSFVTGEGIVPTLIKIDTEGYELAVLRGFLQTLRLMRPVVVFEYSAMTKEQLRTQADLNALFGDGYAFYGILPSREMPKIVPFRHGRRYENVVAWPLNGPTPEETLTFKR